MQNQAMNEEMLRCYSVLELRPSASPMEVRQAYRDLVKVWHPDRFGHDPALQLKAQEKLKEINAAFDRLQIHAAQELGSSPANDQKPPPEAGHQVDRYVYYRVCCDEIVGPSKFRNSQWGDTRITDAWVRAMSEFTAKVRAVEYVLDESPKFVSSGVLTHTDFNERKIYVSRSASVNLKSTLVPLSMIFIRDLLNGIPKCQVEMISRALTCAGWNGKLRFEGENYLLAELILCNQAAEYFLDRRLNEKSEGSRWWSDFSSHCKVKYGKAATLREFGILIGYHLMYLPSGKKVP